MMQQYMEIKEKHKDALLFFRLGDFYELFFDDARIASQLLGLHLTSRETGRGGKSPMCGLPHHAAEGYILRLTEAGHKVALCEQLAAEGRKGELMERKVVRVYTPGTVFDDTASTGNYIAAICAEDDGAFGLAYADVSTGDFYATDFDSADKLTDELHKIIPREIIVNPDFPGIAAIKADIGIMPNYYHFWAFLYDFAYEKIKAHFGTDSITDFGLQNKNSAGASGALLQYLHETQQSKLSHICKITVYAPTDFLILDRHTFRNLELTETLREKDTVGTLFWVMDQTKTPMGKRLLRKWMERPLASVKDIATRQEAVGEFLENPARRGHMRRALGKISDIERLCGKLTYWRVTVGDFVSLKQSIAAIADVKRLLEGMASALNTYFWDNLDELRDVYDKIDRAFGETSHANAKESGIFADGYDADLDGARALKNLHLQALSDFEQSEKQKTGIKGLKVDQNKIFGYFIEVQNSRRDAVPAHYQRKQTLSNCERYITEELMQLQADILTATVSVLQIEQHLWSRFHKEIAGEVPRIKQTAHMVATVDVLQSMGEIADKYNYARPQLEANVTGAIDIREGRHPVVERLSADSFVPNDTYLDDCGNKIAIITGPNMAGKSTFLRQVALICIMAQMGSFVPASAAKLPVCDRVFTRIGASDDIGRGQSTFMVEMNETANILDNATHRSLIIMDEIGRGTGTVDGFSIAMSVVEYISSEISAKTLFATHYHEMTAAEGKITGVANYRMQVQDDGENITFLHKVVPGGADKSYGIFVAKLAGLPNSVIERSKQIQKQLEAGNIFPNDNTIPQKSDIDAINKELRNINRIFLEEYGAIGENEWIKRDILTSLQKVKNSLKNLEGPW
jgi:DNA mismatch repair protein MutS